VSGYTISTIFRVHNSGAAFPPVAIPVKKLLLTIASSPERREEKPEENDDDR